MAETDFKKSGIENDDAESRNRPPESVAMAGNSIWGPCEDRVGDKTKVPGRSWFSSPGTRGGLKVPGKYLLGGLLLPVIYLGLDYLFQEIDFFRYRPWLVTRLSVLSFILSNLCLAAFGLHVCRKYSLWTFSGRPGLKKIGVEFLLSILYFIPLRIVIGIVIAVILVLTNLSLEPSPLISYAAFAPNNKALLFFLVIGFLVSPFVEELFFRAFLYNAMKTRVSLFWALVLQALVFALCHRYGLLLSVAIFILGAGFALVYEKRQTLLAPGFLHMLNNALIVIPFALLIVNNLHSVAQTHPEAAEAPAWFSLIPPAYIEKQPDAEAQLEYARKTWGSEGKKEWKREINAFNAVGYFFPKDQNRIGEALLGTVYIYFHSLGDYRRAIHTAGKLKLKFPDQRERCAKAAVKQGWSYYMIKEFDSSRRVFNEVVHEYPEFENEVKEALKGLVWLDAVSASGGLPRESAVESGS